MITKVEGFSITSAYLTEDRMAMTTVEREALTTTRRVFGLTTFDKDLESWWFLNEALEWIKLEMTGDFSVYGTLTSIGPDPDLIQNGAFEEWIATLDLTVTPCNVFSRKPNVTLFENDIKAHGSVEISETTITIKVNTNNDIYYILN